MVQHGFCYVRSAVSNPGAIEAFRRQLAAELACAGSDTGASGASSTDASHSGSGSAVTWAADRNTPAVQLDDHSTWPKKGARRVTETVPVSQGLHWQQLLQSPKLETVLDALLGQGGWELNANLDPVGIGHTADEAVRHWYCPVVFPEAPFTAPAPESAPASISAHAHAPAPAPAGTRYRCMQLCSWKEELALNGVHREEDAWWRWQPVNRRRVCGKGWHIDIGPGFDLAWHRTLEGHAFQGLVLLVLLNDWLPGMGGTALATGSHKWVEGQIREAEAEAEAGAEAGTTGLAHKELNQRCIDHMTRLARSKKVCVSVFCVQVCASLTFHHSR
eukprot:GSChrysophyteH2.ASY1.ANO1.1201.1 assembled CDS